jgi:hypothetical protein
LNVNGQNTGPYTLAQLQGMIAPGQFTKASMVWKAGMPQWQPAAAMEEFSSLFAPEPPPAAAWHLHINGQQQGPYALPELEALARSAQLTRETFAWRANMAQWQKAGEIAELAAVFAQGATTPPPMPPGAGMPPPPPGA